MARWQSSRTVRPRTAGVLSLAYIPGRWSTPCRSSPALETVSSIEKPYCMKKVSKKRAKELLALAALPDDKIDLTDVPEVLDWSHGVVGKFYRPTKKPLTIRRQLRDRKSTRLNSSHGYISYAVFCLKKKKKY